jgi:hypothetical protein
VPKHRYNRNNHNKYNPPLEFKDTAAVDLGDTPVDTGRPRFASSALILAPSFIDTISTLPGGTRAALFLEFVLFVCVKFGFRVGHLDVKNEVKRVSAGGAPSLVSLLIHVPGDSDAKTRGITLKEVFSTFGKVPDGEHWETPA